MPLPGVRFASQGSVGPTDPMVLVTVGAGNLRGSAQDGDIIVIVQSQASTSTDSPSYPATPSGYTSTLTRAATADAGTGGSGGYVAVRISRAVATSTTRTTSVAGTHEATLIMRHPKGQTLAVSNIGGNQTDDGTGYGANCVGYVHLAIDAVSNGTSTVNPVADTGTVEGLEDNGERNEEREIQAVVQTVPSIESRFCACEWEIAGWVRENYAYNSAVSLAGGSGDVRTWLACYTA